MIRPSSPGTAPVCTVLGVRGVTPGGEPGNPPPHGGGIASACSSVSATVSTTNNTRIGWTLTLFAALAAPACGAGGPAGALATPPTFEPVGQTKCSIAASQSRPLIVEWPAADRGDLEAISKRGLVAVRYTGCELVVLRQCTLGGSYGYTALTKKDEQVAVRDQDELYANLPLGAVKLEAVLAKAGELDVRMSIVGKYEAGSAPLPFPDFDQIRALLPPGLVMEAGPPPDARTCPEATHFISGMTVGAFEMVAGGRGAVGGGVTVAGAGAGAKTSAERELLNRDGDPAACARATGKDTAPPDGCGAILRLELQPLAAAGRPHEPGLSAPSGSQQARAERGNAGAQPVAEPKGEADARTPGPAQAGSPRLASGPLLSVGSGSTTVEALVRDATGTLWHGERAARWRWSRVPAPAGVEPELLLSIAGHAAAWVRDGRGEVSRAWLDRPQWQTVAGAPVAGSLGAIGPDGGTGGLAVARDDAGRLWQAVPDSSSPSWGSLATDAGGPPALAANADGTLEVLAARSDSRLWHLRQRQPRGAFGTWESLGGPAIQGKPAVVRGDKGHLTVFARDTEGKLQHAWQWSPGGKWSAWLSLGGELGGNPVAVKTHDGRMAVLARFRDGSLHVLWQQAAYGPWGEWRDLGVGVVGDPAAVASDQGIFVLRTDPDGSLWEGATSSAGGSFKPWVPIDLSEPSSP